MEWIGDPSSDRFHLSRNTVLRTLEVRGSHLFREYGHTLKKLLSTITSPLFSDNVIVLTKEVVPWSSWAGADAFREMYEIKKFRLIFCLEMLDASRVSNPRDMIMAVQGELAEGSFDFLPCPPLVLSRTVTQDDLYIM